MKKSKLIGVVLLIVFGAFTAYNIIRLMNDDLFQSNVKKDRPKAENQSKNTNKHTQLPWQIKHQTNEYDKTQSIGVFGLTLGDSTILEAIRLFEKTAEFGLFEDENQELSAEVYISNVKLGLLSAKVVLVADMPQEALKRFKEMAIKQRTKRKATPNNRWQYSLSYDQSKQVSAYPFKQLIYLSKPKYTQKQINYFGKPQSSLQVEDKQYVFYPDKQLIIEWFVNQRVVLHYLTSVQYQIFQSKIQTEATSNNE